jgi:hypothetical protein
LNFKILALIKRFILNGKDANDNRERVIKVEKLHGLNENRCNNDVRVLKNICHSGAF